jgi:hypothetical protein
VISSDEARAAAKTSIRDPVLQADPLFAPWARATIGDPEIVRTLQHEPSYWLVPVRLQGRVVGFVRVNLDGRVGAVGAYYRDPLHLGSSPRVVTHIDAETAATQAAASVDPALGETASTPVYVHDGPPGREAWLIEVTRQGRATRWVFVTPGGLYERPAGTHRDAAIE